MQEATLVATVGGQPQVVTFALDLLLERGHIISDVIAVHLAPEEPRLRQALDRLSHEFRRDIYRERHCRFRTLQVQRGDEPIADIRTKADADAVWQTFYALFVDLKERHRPIHLCVAGGRRLMGYLAMSAATFLFSHADAIWHLHTPEDVQRQVRDGRRMHPRPEDGARLVEVPFIPLGAHFPLLKTLASAPPEEVRAAAVRWLDAEERRRCQEVWDQLTPRQRDVLVLISQGLTLKEIAAHLHISQNTVNTHKRTIMQHARNAWGIPPDKYETYHFLRERFETFCSQYTHRLRQNKPTNSPITPFSPEE